MLAPPSLPIGRLIDRRIAPPLIGLVLVALATALAHAYRPELWVNLLAVGAWAIGLAAVTLSWIGTHEVRRAVSRAPFPRGLLRHCAVLLALAMLVRTAWLGTVPANLNGDAFSQALDAVAFLEGRHVNVFGTSDWYGVPLMYPWLGSFFLRAFGQEPWAWRLYTAIAAAVTVPLVYVLVRVQFARARLALLAATLLTFYHIHVYFSRIGSNQGFDALFTAALLLSLVLAHRRPNTGLWWYVAGVVAGLGFYFYFALRGVAAIGLLIVLVWAVFRQAPRFRAPMWYLTGLALAVAPLAAKPAGFGVAHTGRLHQVLAMPGAGDAPLAAELSTRALVALRSIYGTTLRGWYHSDAGVLVSPLELILFVIGVLVAIGLVRRAGWIHPFLLFSVLAAAAVFVENPIMAQRVTAVAVPACVLVAVGVDWVSGHSPKPVRGAVAAVLVLVVVSWNLHHLFVVHMPRRTNDATSMIATELARRLVEEPDVTRIVVCGGDVMGWDSHSALQFRRPGLRGRDVTSDAPSPTEEDDVTTAYVVLPACDELRQRLARVPWLLGQDLRYRTAAPGETLRMYADTHGIGYASWVPTADKAPLAPGEAVVATLFLARGR